MLSRNNVQEDLSMSGEACRRCCIKINDLAVHINGHCILENINLHVHCGDVLAVVGPNGAGKTTLLRAILGEVPYQGNMVSLMGGVERRRPRIGYVPQKIQLDLDSPVSVADLVAAAISSKPVWLGVSQKLLEKIKKILSVFSADHLIDRRIGALSGGELQRVLLAVAMTAEPELLLLDEPEAGIDVRGQALFYELVRDLKKEHHISVIMVTHDLVGIGSFVDRVVVLDRTVITEGTPQEVFEDARVLHVFEGDPQALLLEKRSL